MNGNGQHPLFLPARKLAENRAIAEEWFGHSRAKELEEVAKIVSDTTDVSFMSAYVLAIQLEKEFDDAAVMFTRSLALIEETEGQVGTFPQALLQVVLTERYK